MSQTILKIIPANPGFVPSEARQAEAALLISGLLGEVVIRLRTTDSVEFVDQGELFERVCCNLCQQELPNEDWQEAMAVAHVNGFKDLEFVTPCCQRKSSLNDLIYCSTAGFARFSVEIEDPQNEVDEEHLAELQHVLGTQLKVIWARY